MGVAHGGYCIGASWALMATLFALGVMSLAWMATITVLIAAERLLDRRSRLVVMALLIALGVWVALRPTPCPRSPFPARCRCTRCRAVSPPHGERSHGAAASRVRREPTMTFVTADMRHLPLADRDAARQPPSWSMPGRKERHIQ